MSRRRRLAGMGAGLLVVLLVAGWMAWSSPGGPDGASSPTATRARRAGPGELTVNDLHGVEQLQARFNADQGVPRLVLALAPT
jgi:hypothetical protein